MPNQRKLAMSTDSDKYREKDGTMLFLARTQTDMLLVPTGAADAFFEATKLFTDHRVFLECSAGTILDIVRRQSAIKSVRTIPLCSSFASDYYRSHIVKHRDQLCAREEQKGGFVHPVKLGFDPTKWREWDESYDIVTYE